ncbi:MAG TPA: hypothetical protein VL095_03165, partial [Flavisolibacter sp.]|nr:hypothetical protein [Flavisolibacter sp.]
MMNRITERKRVRRKGSQIVAVKDGLIKMFNEQLSMLNVQLQTPNTQLQTPNPKLQIINI